MRAVAFLGANPERTKKGRLKNAVEIDSLKNAAELDERNVPQIVLVIQAQFIKAQKGDVEARDWICKMLGVNPKDLPVFPHLEGKPQPGDASSGAGESGATRYHLIRGEKPSDPESPEEGGGEATQAIDAAMAALEEAASGGSPLDEEGGPDA